MSREPVVGRHPSLANLMPERGLAKVQPGLPDMSDRTWWEGQLDRLGEAVFAASPGRAAPLLARFDGLVGKLGSGDRDHELLQASRVDWALCDAELASPGDTWAWRAAHGRMGIKANRSVTTFIRTM